jgi:hypothetical protein
MIGVRVVVDVLVVVVVAVVVFVGAERLIIHTLSLYIYIYIYTCRVYDVYATAAAAAVHNLTGRRVGLPDKQCSINEIEFRS